MHGKVSHCSSPSVRATQSFKASGKEYYETKNKSNVLRLFFVLKMKNMFLMFVLFVKNKKRSVRVVLFLKNETISV